jgi:hypothetical protein
MTAFGEGNRCPGETKEQVEKRGNGRPRSRTNTKGEADLHCHFSSRSACDSSPPPLGPTHMQRGSVFPEASMITTLGAPSREAAPIASQNSGTAAV